MGVHTVKTNHLPFKRLWLACIFLVLPWWASAQTPLERATEARLRALPASGSSQLSKLSGLIDQGKLSEADDFLASETRYFLFDNKAESLPLLRRLAKGYNQQFEPKLDAANAALLQVNGKKPQDWQQERKTLEAANGLATEYLARRIFSGPEFRSPKLDELQSRIYKVGNTLRDLAAVAFKQFDHTLGANFFTAYPIDLPKNYLVDNEAALADVLSRLTAAQVLAFRTQYEPWLATAANNTEQARSPVRNLTPVERAKEPGLPTDSLVKTKLALVDVTSKALLAEGQIEFPTQIDQDLPLEVSKSSLDELTAIAGKSDAKLVIILDVAASKVSRRVTGKADNSSQFVAGRHSEPNPAYPLALHKVLQIQNEIAETRGLATNARQGLLAGVTLILLNDQLDKAKQELLNTPRTILHDDMQAYKYSVSDITAVRTLTARYHVIDKAAKRYVTGVVDLSESKSFKLAYNFHDRDPDAFGLSTRYNRESDIASYEQSPMTLKASILMDDYLKNQHNTKPLASMDALRTEMLADRNTSLAAYKGNQYDAKPRNDTRFDSVVVIRTPKSLGSGFFVAPDLVMTNFHVVEGSQYVEMKMYNGLETFGKVVKSDVRLDLALIKVQSRGVPVSFFEGNTLELGATVEAIGHPKGLSFTITRGVVSAVRKRPSVFAVGGKDVLFIQTDAALNPGNSGGPLFLNNKVIGVNDNFLMAGNGGLSFAIHYAEVKEFLKDTF